MTHKDRLFAALNRRIPDHVPTFELEFQLAPVMFGGYLKPESTHFKTLHTLSQREREKRLYDMAAFYAYVYDQLDHSAISLAGVDGHLGGLNPETNRFSPEYELFIRYLREITADRVPLAMVACGTFAVPDGNEMYTFAYRTADDPDGLCAEAQARADDAARSIRASAELGISVVLECSDYCYNSGPFLSPEMFGEFIQPYLAQEVEAARHSGMYFIKHTDGNIMPIIDQLVDCAPHALHSLDPMAGVDIRTVKERYGNRVCLCGNVHCAAMQTGTVEEVQQSAEYCLTYGKPGGGYIYCTSNIPFRGLPPERYQLVLDVWKRMRAYETRAA